MIEQHMHCDRCYLAIPLVGEDESGEQVIVKPTILQVPWVTVGPQGLVVTPKNVPVCPSCAAEVKQEQANAAVASRIAVVQQVPAGISRIH
jgi:hypothetical protein